MSGITGKRQATLRKEKSKRHSDVMKNQEATQRRYKKNRGKRHSDIMVVKHFD